MTGLKNWPQGWNTIYGLHMWNNLYFRRSGDLLS